MDLSARLERQLIVTERRCEEAAVRTGKKAAVDTGKKSKKVVEKSKKSKKVIEQSKKYKKGVKKVIISLNDLLVSDT
jgi:hypothetical protein